MNNIILISPPAAGKGTQSERIRQKYQIPHISTGDLLRSVADSQSEMGSLVRTIMSKGELVSDDIVLKLLEQRIMQPDCINGYILDGFPRTIPQAEKYLEMLRRLNRPLGKVIYLNLPVETAKKRIVGRLSCKGCPDIYNDQFEDTKPKRFGTCDSCNSALFRRDDDTEEAFNERYNQFMQHTYPLVEFFEKQGLLFRVGSGINKDRTFSEIEKALG